MVISCPECSTRFRVDDAKIPAKGAKIRCARCKHIFSVAPPAPLETAFEEIAAPTAYVSTPAEEPAKVEAPVSASRPVEVEEPSSSSDDFGFDDIDSPEIGAGANDDLDPSAFDDDATVSDDDDFSFGGDYGNVSLGDNEETEADEPFSFEAPAPKTAQPAAAVEQDHFSFTPSKKVTTEMPDPLADSFKEDESLGDISLPPNEDAFFLEDPEMAPLSSASKPKGRNPLSTVLLFLLVLILLILAGGGYLMWKEGPAGIEQLISQLTGQPAASEVSGAIRLNNLQGSFITNRKVGELFVIQGVAINNLSEARAAIQVKGIIFDKDGKQLLQKTIFCGNPISDSDLRKLPYSKIEEIMGNQFGESLANLNVTPNQAIPFTIVFRQLPKTLSEFVVEVADSKPAAQ